MIIPSSGNLLTSEVDALVNTVNTVGVMGKGIALQFKNAYPRNFKDYAAACKRGEVMTGRMFVHATQLLTTPRFIVNFPTKRHWKERSRLEYVQFGLVDLVRIVGELGIESIAVPPLGCGNGGLGWADVEPLIREAFEALPSVRVLLYPPAGAPAPESMIIRTSRPPLTLPRAALIRLIERYLVSDYALTALEAQKLAYFLQAAGLPMKLKYVKAQYGPYAENLNHALQSLEGHYLRGYGDRSTEMVIRTIPGAGREAMELLATSHEFSEQIDRVAELVRGFETPYGLELLATTHWAAKDTDASLASVLAYVRSWNTRKGEIFTETHVIKALRRLSEFNFVSECEPAHS